MLTLIGASGHAKVIVEIAELLSIPIGGLLDKDSSISSLLDYPVLPFLEERLNDTNNYIISIGSNKTRKEIALSQPHLTYATLLHPQTNISRRAKIGTGTVGMAGATVNCESVIGQHVILNTNCSIDHECDIADFVHISPNASLAGNVTVGEGTHVGIGACIIQGITIGKWCTIGAGSVIIADVPDGATVVGSPGKIIKYSE